MENNVVKNNLGKPLAHKCVTGGKEHTVTIENAYLTGKQAVEKDLIAEAVCNGCGVVVSKMYTDNMWV